MDSYFAYIRVSTVRQGERGTSLGEQRSAIEAYATRNGLSITAWYEEMETAAKQGRRQFTRMLAELAKRRARGVVIHKIDRSARNLRDWAQLGDLIDAGVDVRFAHESLDLNSRGGRLSADIQAVVAADFIRNHRQVVRMGFEGRLKQGVYPLPAPRGYRDEGKGKAKSIDPQLGPLVRLAFELYGSGAYTFDTLREELFRRGLRTKTGHALSPHGISVMLRNPFYIGLIRIKKTNQLFDGAHQPLVSKVLFDRVQAVMGGRMFARPQKHSHTFRRMIRCGVCDYALVAEIQKGTTYYRCHTRTCAGTCIPERDVDQAIREQLSRYVLSDQDVRDISDLAKEIQGEAVQAEEGRISTLERDLAKCEERLTRLTDAFLDATIDQEAFELRKSSLLTDRLALRTALETKVDSETFGDRVLKNLELLCRAYLGYESAISNEKREIVRDLTSNLVARGKTVEITMRNEIAAILERRLFP